MASIMPEAMGSGSANSLPSDSTSSVIPSKRQQPQLQQQQQKQARNEQPARLVYMAPGLLAAVPGMIAQIKETLARDAHMMLPRLAKLVRGILYVAFGLQLSPTDNANLAYQPPDLDEFDHVQLQDPAVQELAGVMRECPEELLKQARGCLRHYHPEAPSLLRDEINLDDLDREVASMMRLMDEHIQALQPWGCKLVQHYEQIKSTFPQSFGTKLNSAT